MSSGILLGYEIGTGTPVEIPLSHLIVTGITHLSGKSTTLEALLKRSGKRAIVFKTKIGEKEFTAGTQIRPFFKNRSDYEFVKSLIEAYAREKLSLEKGTLMQLCKGAKDLVEIKKRVDDAIQTGKLRGIKEEIYTRLQHYLENLIPQIQSVNLSRTLDLTEGINVVNLQQFSSEAQSLIIEATTMEVLTNLKDTIIVIPEAWKFLPQKYSNPCKRAVEEYIRQGATNHNYLWVDSQDMAGVDKTTLKQISTWILGFQKERNEVKHTLDQIPLSKQQKPGVDEIMNLRTGQFYVSTYDFIKKVYVQPIWMESDTAIGISLGRMRIEDIHEPNPPDPSHGQNIQDTEISLLRQQVFKRIDDLDEKISKLTRINEDELVQKILSRFPKTLLTVYQVAPLEKLKKGFLEETKAKILFEVAQLSPEQRKIIRFVESAGKGVNQTELVSRCFFLSSTSGGSRHKVLNLCKELDTLKLVRKDKNNVIYPNLKTRVADLLKFHGAMDDEVELVYQHILAETGDGK